MGQAPILGHNDEETGWITAKKKTTCIFTHETTRQEIRPRAQINCKADLCSSSSCYASKYRVLKITMNRNNDGPSVMSGTAERVSIFFKTESSRFFA